MPFTLHQATVADAEAIATINTISHYSRKDNELVMLSLGTASREDTISNLTERITYNMGNDYHVYLVAKEDSPAGKLMGFAHWIPPRDAVAGREEEAEAAAHYRATMPAGMNVPLREEFRNKILAMQKENFGDARHFMLANIAVLPECRQQGVASTLISWAFPQADREGVIVYLNAWEGNEPATRVYYRLGFEVVGRFEIDLKEFGGKTVNKQFGMSRKPKKVEASNEM